MKSKGKVTSFFFYFYRVEELAVVKAVEVAKQAPRALEARPAKMRLNKTKKGKQRRENRRVKGVKTNLALLIKQLTRLRWLRRGYWRKKRKRMMML